MLALIAVQEAVTFGLGTSLMPATGTETLDGITIGMLLAGALLLALMAQRHGTRRPWRAIGARRRLGATRLRGRDGYQSKHRLTDPAEGWTWPESRRGAPRHAAPSRSIPVSVPAALAGRFAIAAGTLTIAD